MGRYPGFIWLGLKWHHKCLCKRKVGAARVRGEGHVMTEAGSELCALKMEVGPQTKEYKQPLEREKGKETSPPL